MDKSSITAREWHVRKALPEDLPMIAEIEKLSFHRPWSFDSIESFYYRKTSDIYVWRDRNRISGYIIAEHVLDQAELHRIAMIPFIRKMGIGTLLFQTKVSGDRGRHDLFGGQRIKRSSVSVLFKEWI